MEDIDATPRSSEIEESREGEAGSWSQDTIESPSLSETPDQPDAEFADSQSQGDPPSLNRPTKESLSSSLEALSALLDETLEQAKPKDLSAPNRPYDRNEPPAGSVVITGTGFHLAGVGEQKSVDSTALDAMTQLVIAAGTTALKDAGIPLGERDQIEEGEAAGLAAWILPEPLRHETGVIFASALPRANDLHNLIDRYAGYKRTYDQLKMLGGLSRSSSSERAEKIKQIVRMLNEIASDLEDGGDPETVFGAMVIDYAKTAASLGVLGPTAQLRSAGMAQAVAQAEDWIRTGRCRRVIIISVTLADADGVGRWMRFNEEEVGRSGPSSTHDSERERANGAEGWGACSLVLESEDAVRERGMRGVAELLGSEIGSAISGSGQALIDQTSLIMERLVSGGERRFDLYRADMAPRLVFLAGEASQSSDDFPFGLSVLETVFGASAEKVITTSLAPQGEHAAGSEFSAPLGWEDAISAKILESGYVPPAPDHWFADAALDRFLLSKGENYVPHYLLNMGRISNSELAMTLLRWIPGEADRVDNNDTYQQWLDGITGYDETEVEVMDNILRIVVQDISGDQPKASSWRYGVGPTILALVDDWAPPADPPEKIVGLATMLDGSGFEEELADLPHDELEEEAVSPTVQAQDPIPLDEASQPEIELDAIAFQTLMITSEHSGYAIDAIGLDDDLKTGLALGEKEHAELLIDICQAFGISGYVNLNIGDYPTLAHMIALVLKKRPDLVDGEAQEEQEEETVPTDGEKPEGDSPSAVALQIVANQTGYPVDMLEISLDMDLEDDLGIDAIEQMEIFRALCQTFTLECPESNQLAGFSTLALIIAYLQEETGDLEPILAADALSGQKPHVQEGVEDLGTDGESVEGRPIEFAIADTVLLITSEQIGIPAHEINIDADMVEELGLDERTQAEVVSAVLESFGIPQPEGMRPSDYPTLSALIAFVRESRPDLVDTELLPAGGIEETLISPVVIGGREGERPITYLRSIPRSKPLPSLEDCQPTGISLTGKRVVVMSDRGGVGELLGKLLPELEASVLTLTATTHGDELDECILDWLEEGPVDGVYWLPALDVEPPLAQMSIETWRELNRQRVKNLHRIMRTLYSSINHPGSFLVTATRMGGTHGFGDSGALTPLGGSVTGFAKAFKLERDRIDPGQDGQGLKGTSSPLVKVVDFEKDRTAEEIAKALVAETTSDPEALEVGYMGKDRYGVTLVETPFSDDQTGLTLDQETIYLVTGAAGRLTNEIVADLASNGGTFYLLDYVAAPDRDDPRVALLRTDKKALREQLVDEIKTAVPEPTASMVEKIMKAIEREEAALRAIESVERHGGSAHYMCVDLLDETAVAQVIDDIRDSHGLINVLVHAAGLEMSRALPDKDPVQFNLVYDVKADGFFNLLKASEEMPLDATVVFGSMETRHGTWGRCDSSAAADLMRKITSSLAWQRPETRGVAISWIAEGKNAFDSRRMVDESLPAVSTGFSIVRDELTASSFHGEVIVRIDKADPQED
jgi:NAD(P)-dependent dehydrogenase (short-subunit alcohol dehydrogenase family)/acyl carrier protein